MQLRKESLISPEFEPLTFAIRVQKVLKRFRRKESTRKRANRDECTRVRKLSFKNILMCIIMYF